MSAQNAGYSSWTIVSRGLMNIYFMHRLGYSQVIDHDCNEHPICALYIAREVWLTQDEGLGS